MTQAIQHYCYEQRIGYTINTIKFKKKQSISNNKIVYPKSG